MGLHVPSGPTIIHTYDDDDDDDEGSTCRFLIFNIFTHDPHELYILIQSGLIVRKKKTGKSQH